MKKARYILLLALVFIGAAITISGKVSDDNKISSDNESSTSGEIAPKLVVGIVIDQMRYDYLYRYWDQYSDGGFKRLIKGGFSCENHHFSYAPTYTGPGHASIYAGTTPAVHGIIANDWWSKETKEWMYCVADTTVTPVGTTAEMEKRSPRNIFVTNMSDEIKLANNYRGKIISVSIKDRGAILPGGKLADAAYWFTGIEGGKFVSSSYYMDVLPKWAQKFNDSKTIKNYLKEGWKPLLDMDEYTQSNPDDSPYEKVFMETTKAVFPYDLWAHSQGGKNANVLKETPFGNNLITDFGLLALEEEKLGEDDIVDVLTLSYSSPDYIGHNNGTRSVEIQDTYLRLDLSLEYLFKQLDEKVGEGEYLLFLTADHGAAIVPQELIDHKVNVEYFDRNSFVSFVKKATSKRYGSKKIIENMSNSQIFLSDKTMSDLGLVKKEVEDFLADKIMEFPGIFITTTATLMREGNFSGHRLLLQKGYNQKRSGNILYAINPGWISYPETGTTHGSPFNYDTHVPFILYGWGIEAGSTTRRTLVEDIAPTITSLLHVQAPMASTGNPVWEVNEIKK